MLQHHLEVTESIRANADTLTKTWMIMYTKCNVLVRRYHKYPYIPRVKVGKNFWAAVNAGGAVMAARFDVPTHF